MMPCGVRPDRPPPGYATNINGVNCDGMQPIASNPRYNPFLLAAGQVVCGSASPAPIPHGSAQGLGSLINTPVLGRNAAYAPGLSSAPIQWDGYRRGTFSCPSGGTLSMALLLYEGPCQGTALSGVSHTPVVYCRSDAP